MHFPPEVLHSSAVRSSEPAKCASLDWPSTSLLPLMSTSPPLLLSPHASQGRRPGRRRSDWQPAPQFLPPPRDGIIPTQHSPAHIFLRDRQHHLASALGPQ